jgi:hypothetical protein
VRDVAEDRPARGRGGPGKTAAVVGDGAVGLLAVLTGACARRRSAAGHSLPDLAQAASGWRSSTGVSAWAAGFGTRSSSAASSAPATAMPAAPMNAAE